MNMINKYHGALFLDSSDPDMVRKWDETGVIDGVTTNPQIMLDNGVTPANYIKTIKEISAIMGNRSVSVELTSDRNSFDEQVKEAKKLNEVADNITIKVPFNPENPLSLKLIHYLAIDLKMSINVTVLMNFEQLLLAARALRGGKKISFISLFWGRAIEDWVNRSGESWAPVGLRVGNVSSVNDSPAKITAEIVKTCNTDGFENVNLIVGSVRNATMVGEAIAAGANVVTVPADIMTAMLYSRRALETLRQFDDAWNKINEKK